MASTDQQLPSKRASLVLAVALAFAHFALAVWFASMTPYRAPGVVISSGRAEVSDIGAPDERQHANYVAHLLEGKGFPVFDPHDPHLGETYQSHQPPAFYVLAASWCKLIGRGPDDIAPASGGAPAGVGTSFRALNALIGAGTVLGTYFLVLWGFDRRGFAVVAAAIVALLPMNVALSGAISNDPLLFCLCTWVLALTAKALETGWNLRLGVAIGVLAGIALLTKTTALALVPILVLAIFIKPGLRPDLKVIAAVALPALLLAAPWWMRNQTLYGDPFAIKAFNQAFVNSPQAKSFIESFGLPSYLLSWVGWWTARSFFGSFGYMDIWLNETGLPTGSAPNAIYRVLLALFLVIVVGWAASLKTDREKSAIHWLNGLFVAVVFLLFLRFNLQYFQAQARYLFPAIAPIAAGLSMGLRQLSKDRWALALALVVAVLGGLVIYAGTRLPGEFEKRTFGISQHDSILHQVRNVT